MTDYTHLANPGVASPGLAPPGATTQISSIQGTQASTATRQKPVETSTPAPAADGAQISSASSTLAASMQLSDVRMDKVSAIQSAIANGTYSVSAGQVADTLIASMLK